MTSIPRQLCHPVSPLRCAGLACFGPVGPSDHPRWNQLEFTRHCITALMRFTRQPWELIVINNGSSDGTAQYLGGVQDDAAVPVTLVANETNRGFPAAINQGLQFARGEYLVLANNDVVVNDGWLDQLTGLTAVRGTAEGIYAGSDVTFIDLAGRGEIRRLRSARRFADKWGLQQTNGRRIALEPFTGKPRNRSNKRVPSRTMPARPATGTARVSSAPAARAASPWWTTSGCFRCAMTSAGRIAFTSKFWHGSTIMDWSPRSRTSNPFSRSPVPMKADPSRMRRAPYQWETLRCFLTPADGGRLRRK